MTNISVNKSVQHTKSFLNGDVPGMLLFHEVFCDLREFLTQKMTSLHPVVLVGFLPLLLTTLCNLKKPHGGFYFLLF